MYRIFRESVSWEDSTSVHAFAVLFEPHQRRVDDATRIRRKSIQRRSNSSTSFGSSRTRRHPSALTSNGGGGATNTARATSPRSSPSLFDYDLNGAYPSAPPVLPLVSTLSFRHPSPQQSVHSNQSANLESSSSRPPLSPRGVGSTGSYSHSPSTMSNPNAGAGGGGGGAAVADQMLYAQERRTGASYSHQANQPSRQPYQPQQQSGRPSSEYYDQQQMQQPQPFQQQHARHGSAPPPQEGPSYAAPSHHYDDASLNSSQRTYTAPQQQHHGPNTGGMTRSGSDFIAGPPYGSQQQQQQHGGGPSMSSLSLSMRDPSQSRELQQSTPPQPFGPGSNRSTPRNHSPAPSSPATNGPQQQHPGVGRDFVPPAVGASNSSMGPGTAAASAANISSPSMNSLSGSDRVNNRLSQLVSNNSVSGRSMRDAPPPAPQTIAGEPLHDLGRAVALLRSSKFYAEGFLMKRVDIGPDGKPHSGQGDAVWAKWFVQLSGTIMSTWNAAEMEQAARQNRTVPPQYLNLADVFVYPLPPHPSAPPTPTTFQFAINSAGLNRVLFCAPHEGSMMMWINAIRLAAWERSRTNEIYTGTLLGMREPKPAGWIGFDAGLTPPGSPANATGGKFEGYLKARLPGETEWRKTWAVLIKSKKQEPGALFASVTKKKDRRSSLLGAFGKKHVDLTDIDDLPGDGAFATMAFYASKPTKKEAPLCVVQHVFYASAIYPESEKLIDRSGLFKIEGTFLNPHDRYKLGWGVGGRAERQGYALLMVEEGAAAAMLQWIVGISDVFKVSWSEGPSVINLFLTSTMLSPLQLYGRPRAFSFDPRDPSSLYFALPIGPNRDRQFLDRELVDALEVNELRPRAIRAVFHNILFDRMRGVRSSVLPPPQAVLPASAPQLEPVSRTPPIQIREEDEDEPETEAEAEKRVNEEYGLGGTRDTTQLSTIGESESPPAGSLFAPAVARPSSSIYHSAGDTAEEPVVNYANFTSSQPAKRGETPSPPPVITTTNHLTPRQALPKIVTGAEPKAAVASTYATQQQTGAALNFSRPTAAPSQQSADTERGSGSRDAREPLAPPPVPVATNGHGHESIYNLPALGAVAREGKTNKDSAPMPASSVTVNPVMDIPPAPVMTPPLASTSPPVPAKSPERVFKPLSSPPQPDKAQLDDAPANPSALHPIAQVPAAERSLEAEPVTPGGASSDIHSDLLAALQFVDRSESPPPLSSLAPTPSTVYEYGSPEIEQRYRVGPPRRASHSMFDPGSPVDLRQGVAQFTTDPNEVDEYQAEEISTPRLNDQRVEKVGGVASSSSSTKRIDASPAQAAVPFPSSFAPNKRAEERAAAAALAQQALEAQQIAKSRPGRASIVPSASANSVNRKPRAWVDSDEEDEEEDDDEDDDESEGEGEGRDNRQSTLPSSTEPLMMTKRDTQSNGMNRLGSQDRNSRGPNMSSSPSRGDFQVIHPDSPQNPVQPLKPLVNPHGLLHAGIIDKEERSAKALEAAARDTGGPLVSIPSKPPPPQTGLVGAITSLEREKERTGGVGKALTEQQKERKLAEQRQRQLDDLQRQQLAQQQYQMQAQYQQMQMMQAYGSMPPYGGGPAPWMMGGYPGYPPMMPPASQMGPAAPSSQVGSPVMMPHLAGGGRPSSPPMQQNGATSPPLDSQYQQQQQHHFAAQQAAQAAAAAAYQAAMAQFSQPPTSPPLTSEVGANGSPALHASTSMSSFPPAGVYGPPMGAYPNPYAGGYGGPPMMGQHPWMQGYPRQHLMSHGAEGGDEGTPTANATAQGLDRTMSPMQLPH
ncbi:BZ3500_MvSof-1268-A1-R1_Chr6-3g08712 [Microbotryum saponariae]|uniref:BZ3500_MvSof-1268-A1-R1_Chr6-3g08712 protein n=1 Tax=Microbotryum saponariae TaxID=289078 RepID=A0A2X0KJ99_9BASI|nr:BZ3500_MvSof-1268-A1-R1_Chr6-3g08712 [Microbotryum saponariae]SDA07313.1 BZ3501_MvSof-1269-A2-R1_Chr6-2g08415 [Microbotryum saponariae]